MIMVKLKNAVIAIENRQCYNINIALSFTGKG